jgi:hypothetical protein
MVLVTLYLSKKAAKLMLLCELEGYEKIEDVLFASFNRGSCPGICMTEGCDHTTKVELDQTEGYCEACGGRTVTSALVLAGLI